LLASVILYFLIYLVDFQIWEGILKIWFSVKDNHKWIHFALKVSISFAIAVVKIYLTKETYEVARIAVLMVVYIIYGLTFYRCTKKKVIICLSFFICLSLSIEDIVILFGYAILNDGMSKVINDSWLSMYATSIVKMVELSAVLFFRVFVPRFRGLLRLKDFGFVLYVTTIFAIGSNAIFGTELEKNRAFPILLLSAVLILSFFLIGFVVFYAMKSKREREYKDEIAFIDAQLKLSNAMREDMEKILTIREQIKENLCDLGVMLENAQYEQALVYLKSLIPDSNNDIVGKMQSTMLAIVLFEMKLKAERRSVTMDVEMEINDLIIPPKELNSIITNMVENAIEACEKVRKREERKISFRIFLKNKKVVIECRNTYVEKPIYQEGILVSGKMDNINHGYGVSTINYYVEKNNGTMKIRFGKNIFVMIAEFDETIALKGAIPYI